VQFVRTILLLQSTYYVGAGGQHEPISGDRDNDERLWWSAENAVSPHLLTGSK
jgi:hypothetical protein